MLINEIQGLSPNVYVTKKGICLLVTLVLAIETRPCTSMWKEQISLPVKRFEHFSSGSASTHSRVEYMEKLRWSRVGTGCTDWQLGV